MPRISDEARAAAFFREGGEHPKPPSNLSKPEQAIWHAIVDCRPVDFFQPGSLHLLEQLCVAVVAARTVAEVVRKDPMDEDAARVYTNWMQRCAMHCQKLRLSIQSALRCESGKLDEKEPTPKGKKGKGGGLFGSNVITFDGRE